MCGITGRSGSSRLDSAGIERMVAALAHRGPDDRGVWISPEGDVALGHTRLSIVDLSPLGHQPMHSSSERYVLTYNGEIYNFKELRKELEDAGATFRGSSDTEVILAAFEAWGIRGAVERFNGMFAFAVFDRERRAITIGRDRTGEKPLYYGWSDGSFWFASELKSIHASRSARLEIDRDAVALFMRYGYVPAPFCIYRDFFKLPAGTLLTLDGRKLSSMPEGYSGFPGRSSDSPEMYWNPASSTEKVPTVSDADVERRFEELLEDAVARRMVADVPLGAFLSGGIDSSAIVALMQGASSRPVKTFSIGFTEGMVNEAPYAKAVAAHLRTDHTEFMVSAREARDVIPRIPEFFDEPFGDSSQIPTYLVSALARREVTVALSGDGGDELLAGYNRFFWTDSIWRTLRYVPYPLRSTAGNALKLLPVPAWNRLSFLIAPLYSRIDSDRAKFGHRVHRLGETLKVRSGFQLYDRFMRHWLDPIVRGSDPVHTIVDAASGNRGSDFREYLFLDLRTYLPDDILAKVDRVSMAVALETRVPFLDHRLIEFCLELPTRFLVRDNRRKWILRRVLDKYVPPVLIDRPKQGFSIPIDEWLRGPLREWAEDLLSAESLDHEGILETSRVRAVWGEFTRGERSWEHLIWDVLMFRAWMRQYHGS